MRRLWILGMVVFALAATTWLAAQEAARPTFRVKVDMVVLSFTVTDSKGRYINGLKPKDFKILEDGIVQKVNTFAEGNKTPVQLLEDGTTRPLVVNTEEREKGNAADAFVGTNVFVLFDTSNYMYRGFVYASDAIADFIRGLDRADSVAVYTFSRNLNRASPLSRDRNDVITGLRSAVDQGRVAVLYVLDPGPDGSMGDLQWLVDARKSGRLPVLIYQGVLATPVSKVADVVLPGSAWVEKDATYTNDQGHVQAASRAINPPGEAVDDWQILTSVAAALGLPYSYTSSQQVRADVATALADQPAYAALGDVAFNRPMAAEHWLQASNPMERMKWHDMFEDLPPVKGHNVQMEQSPSPTVIPLKLVVDEISRASD